MWVSLLSRAAQGSAPELTIASRRTKSKRGHRGRDQDGQSRSKSERGIIAGGSRAASQHRHPHQQRHVLRSGVPGEGQLVITVAWASDFGRSSPSPKSTEKSPRVPSRKDHLTAITKEPSLPC